MSALCQLQTFENILQSGHSMSALIINSFWLFRHQRTHLTAHFENCALQRIKWAGDFLRHLQNMRIEHRSLKITVTFVEKEDESANPEAVGFFGAFI